MTSPKRRSVKKFAPSSDKRYRGAWEDKNGSGTLTTQNGTITLTQIFLT